MWFSSLARSIPLADGTELKTLDDARKFIARLPAEVKFKAQWIAAAGALDIAANERRWVGAATNAVRIALNEAPPNLTIDALSKETHD
jgi:hypothetical protein